MSFLRDAAVDMVVSLKGYSLSKDAEIALHRLQTEIIRSQEVENIRKRRKHSCPDWDGMVIDEDSPEFDACLCYKNQEKEWVSITLEEIDEIYRTSWFDVYYDLAFAIEAKLKEKNT